MCDVVDHAERDRMIAVVANWKEAQRLDLDAQFLAPFPPRGVVERFTSGHDPADGQIPVRGKHVLGRGSLMDELLAARVEDEQVDATMRKATLAHVAAGDAADDLTGIIEQVNQLIAGARQVEPSKSLWLSWLSEMT